MTLSIIIGCLCGIALGKIFENTKIVLVFKEGSALYSPEVLYESTLETIIGKIRLKKHAS